MPQNKVRESASVPSRAAERGTVIVAFVFAATVLTSLVVVAWEASEQGRREVQRVTSQVGLRNVGDSVITLAADRIWESFLGAAVAPSPGLPEFRAWLGTRGWTPTESRTGIAAVPLQPAHSLTLAGVPTAMALPGALVGSPRLAGARLEVLLLERFDTPDAVVLTFSARLSLSAAADRLRVETVRASYRVSGEPWQGLRYGLLARNVDCMLCHARVDSAARRWNRDPTRRGTFPGTKVGALGGIRYDLSRADTGIAGTLYSRGNLTGTGLAMIAAGPSLYGYQMGADGSLLENALGQLTMGPVNHVQEPAGTPGQLPAGFPPVIPDQNGNRILEPAEFQGVANAASGTVSGGTRVSVPAGRTYAGIGVPALSNTGPLSGSSAGNLMLIGTQANPIVIDGTLAVDGDLVIAGVIKGSGEIVARGNVYVVGPLEYADGVTLDPLTGTMLRTYGVAADGTPNQLALGAGGDVLVGDYLSRTAFPGLPVNGTAGGGFNFTLANITRFNRSEWARTQAMLPGPGGVPVANPNYDPTWVPRYYTLNPGDPVYLHVGADTWFDPATATWQGGQYLQGWDPTKYMALAPGSPAWSAGVIDPLNPLAGWIDPAQLQALWSGYEARAMGGPFNVDAMLYTSNAVLGTARRASAWQGRMRINGGLVGADVGVMAAGNGGAGLTVNHDDRLGSALALRAADGLTLVRLLAE